MQVQAFQLQSVTLRRMPILFALHALENKSYLPGLASQLLMHRRLMHKLAQCLGDAERAKSIHVFPCDVQDAWKLGSPQKKP